MKNVYRFLIGCIFCFVSIVTWSSISEQRVVSAASYTLNSTETLLGLLKPTQKQWQQNCSVATYDVGSHSRADTLSLAKTWTARLERQGWKKLSVVQNAHLWQKGNCRLVLSHAPALRTSFAILMLDNEQSYGSAGSAMLNDGGVFEG